MDGGRSDNAGREDPWCVRSRRGCVFLTGRRIIFVALEPHDFGLHSIDMLLLNIQTAQLRKRLVHPLPAYPILHHTVVK